MGSLVWVTPVDASPANVNIVISEDRCQTLHPEIFTALGINLEEMKLIIVKSSQHFFTGFAPLAAEILYVAGPGP